MRFIEGRARVGGLTSQLVAPKTMEIVELSPPAPGKGEALVRINAMGICGTDIHEWAGRAGRFPMTLGHDAVGILVEYGANSQGPIATGTRVAIDPMLSCDDCSYCNAGRRNLCPEGAYLGMWTAGTMAEFIVVPNRQLVPVPDEVDDESATVVEPVVVALHTLTRAGAEVSGCPVEVIGGGPLGILLAQTMMACGHSVRLHEPRTDRRKVASELGLTVSDVEGPAQPRDEPVLIVETSASIAGAQRGWDLASPGSTVAVVGRSAWEVPLSDVLLRELKVFGVRAGVRRYSEALRMIADGSVRPSSLISHRFRFNDLGKAFAAVADRDSSVMRAVAFMD